MSGRCCCLREGDPSGEPYCWGVSGPENCPHDVNCAYSGGVPPVCVAANMTQDTLITPFEAEPGMLAASDVLLEDMYEVHNLLASSTLGQRVLEYGKTVSEETARIVEEDPELGGRVFQTLMRALSFAKAIDRERLRPGTTSPERRFTEEDYAFGARVAEEVRRRTDDPRLIAALDDLSEQASYFIGMSPADAVAYLDRQAFTA